MQGEVFVVFWNVKRLGEGTDRETKGVTEYTLHFPVYDALVTLPAETTGCTDCGSRSDSSSERPRRQRRVLSRSPSSTSFPKWGSHTAFQSPEAASQATRLTALDAIVTTLSDGAIFDFDPLSRLMWSSLLFAVLRLFPRGGLDDLYAWKHARPRRRHGDYDTSPRPRSRAGSSMRVFAPQEGALLINRGSWASSSSLSPGAVTSQGGGRSAI
ncbi:hypothetical protein EDB85DRAFT_1893201 [Lactarius pseudohatsudake]|nr:hypothetical protein EDB85DRAFT_1893201 [Lactarius pseudohatsudake]